jgi:hypothetical protein
MNQLVFGAVLLILGLAGFGCALESKPRAVKLGWVVEGRNASSKRARVKESKGFR